MVCLFIMTMISILQIVFERTRNILDEDNLVFKHPSPRPLPPRRPRTTHLYARSRLSLTTGKR